MNENINHYLNVEVTHNKETGELIIIDTYDEKTVNLHTITKEEQDMLNSAPNIKIANAFLIIMTAFLLQESIYPISSDLGIFRIIITTLLGTILYSIPVAFLSHLYSYYLEWNSNKKNICIAFGLIIIITLLRIYLIL